MSKISKLWTDSWFQMQSPITKLLYIYLLNHPSLNMVGVVNLNPNVICLELNISMEELKESMKELRGKKLIHIKAISNILYFIVPKHFQSVPKSQASLEKLSKTLNTLPTELVGYLSSLGINTESKVRSFSKPTSQEVTEYALSQGYLINGEEFVNYYDNQTVQYGKKGCWVDARGTEVRDWKAKLRRIWCKDEKKIKTFDEAPEGFKAFYVIEKGVLVTPDGWKGGKPFSKSLTSDIILKREYERRIC